MLSPEKRTAFSHTLSHYLPASAVEPVLDYIVLHSIQMHITRERFSKLGDYRAPSPANNHHAISINGNLPPLFFLWVMLHEMAHLETFLKYRNRVSPHGHEWQECYRTLLLQYRHHFPEEVARLIDRYTKAVPLNRATGRKIEVMLRQQGSPSADDSTILDDLQPGSRFVIRQKPGIVFEAIERRRTRWKCRDIGSGTTYLVAGTAIVEPKE